MHGSTLLPYKDDFLLLAASFSAALLFRDRIDAMLNSLGLQRNPKKVM
jgi:hypothetical protein